MSQDRPEPAWRALLDRQLLSRLERALAFLRPALGADLDIEDVIQQAVLQTISALQKPESAARLDNEEALVRYLITVAKRIFRQWNASRASHPPVSAVPSEEVPDKRAAGLLSDIDAATDIEATINSLPAVHREAARVSVEAELQGRSIPYEELAVRWAVSKATVYRRINAARAAMEQRLDLTDHPPGSGQAN